jgi:hypothetical protein
MMRSPWAEARHQLYMWLIGDRLAWWRWKRELRRVVRRTRP